jgi:glutathione S-transferase
MSDNLTLVIANKAYSSWSLRPWLVLRHSNVPFDEVVISLRQATTAAEIGRYSPSGKVPVLLDGNRKIWESLAIVEYLAERYPDRDLWPADAAARAWARSISSEMHAGFQALRSKLPMNVRRVIPHHRRSPEAEADIARVQAIWGECREVWGAHGSFLFGEFCIADAMFAPVVTRFQTYAVPLEPVCRQYADAILALPAMTEWYRAAAEETVMIADFEVL